MHHTCNIFKYHIGGFIVRNLFLSHAWICNIKICCIFVLMSIMSHDILWILCAMINSPADEQKDFFQINGGVIHSDPIVLAVTIILLLLDFSTGIPALKLWLMTNFHTQPHITP